MAPKKPATARWVNTPNTTIWISTKYGSTARVASSPRTDSSPATTNAIRCIGRKKPWFWRADTTMANNAIGMAAAIPARIPGIMSRSMPA